MNITMPLMNILIGIDVMALFNQEFFVRTVSAVVLGPLVMWAIYVGNYYFLGLAVLMNVILLWEWERMMMKIAFSLSNALITLSGTIGLLTYIYIYLFVNNDEMMYTMTNVMIIAVSMTTIITLLTQYYRKSILSFFGPLYIFIAMFALVSLRMHENGLIVTMNLFAVVWATDIGAYMFGRTLQGPKILPIVSPSKTWSGLMGGMICSAITLFLLQKYTKYGIPANLKYLLILGASSAVIAQVGDFLESGFKRICQIKDSSNIIPGHGGVFDRMDGVLSVSIFWLYLIFYTPYINL